MDTFKKNTITRINNDKRETFDDIIVTEMPMTIFLNGKELSTILCTPEHLLELALGYLYSQRVISKKSAVISAEVDDSRGTAWIKVKGKAGADSGKKIKSHLHISYTQVLHLARLAGERSWLFRQTGGAHSAALCNTEEILLFYEDIGRHNAFDKILGKCLLTSIPTEDKVIVTSGRISSAVMEKVINARIPFIISRSAPTAESVKLANQFGITLIGFARGSRFNIYSNEWRVD